MERSEKETPEKWAYLALSKNKSTTGGFSIIVAAILEGLDAEPYIPIFKTYNLGKEVLPELTNEDLIILGVDSDETRQKMLNGFKCFPLITPHLEDFKLKDGLSILQDVTSHLHRIKISMTVNRVKIIKKTEHIDPLLQENCFTTDVILKTIDKMDSLLETMEENTVIMKNKPYKKERDKLKHRKMVIGVAGIVVILSICLVKSLKDL